MNSPELITFATRVLERALQKAGYMPEPPADPAAVSNPGDMFIDSLAAKIIDFVKHADTAAIAHNAMSSVIEQLRIRNARMALAVGACECFGDDVSCPHCAGSGAPGWRLPDRSHFTAMVRPAMEKVEQFRLSARNGRVHSHQQ